MALDQFSKVRKMLNVKQAMDAMINKDYDRAIHLYTLAIKSDPKDWKAYIQRCNCFLKLNRLDDALKDAEEAIFLNPTQLSGHFRKGCVLMDKKHFRSAEKSFQKALTCDPNDHNSQLKLKEVHRLLLEEFGFKGKETDLLVDKHNTCADITDAIISGKVMAELESTAESVISAESPRIKSDSNDTTDNSYMTITSTNGSIPDFNENESTIGSISDMSLNEGDIRKPKTLPIFRNSMTPKADTSDTVSKSDDESNTPKSRIVKTRPQIFRSIKT